MWLVILIIAIIVGALIGLFSSKDGERGESALSGAVSGGIGCGYLLLQIFLYGLGLMLVIWLFSFLFG